jgi:chromosomal replication initiation ATPase DnaA
MITPEAQRVIDLMVEASGQSQEAICGQSRKRPLPTCRWLIARALVKKGYSTGLAGSMIGRDHATVLYGVKHLDAYLEQLNNPIERYIASKFEAMMDGNG